MAKATIGQYDTDIEIHRVPFIRHTDQIEKIIDEAAQAGAVVCHTLVSPELRADFERIAHEKNVRYVDILGPMMNMVTDVAGVQPRMKPGIIHCLDEEYFKKVEAIEFAVRYDDGKNPAGFAKADMVLIGVSRTSKTPLSMYMAHKKYKVANLPLVPEVQIPEEIFQVPPYRLIGLIIDPYKLNGIRRERMKALGFSGTANYMISSALKMSWLMPKKSCISFTVPSLMYQIKPLKRRRAASCPLLSGIRNYTATNIDR